MRLTRPPRIVTDRLVLRPLRKADAPALARAISDRRVIATTLAIPFPYTLKDADEWIARQAEGLRTGKMVNFAVTLRTDGTLIGGIGFSSVSSAHRRAEIGYWIASRFWNQGYCTEAGRAALGYAFRVLKLQRVYATHFPRNPASGRVMQKVGMKREGFLRRHVCRRGRYEDLVSYAILASEFGRRRR